MRIAAPAPAATKPAAPVAPAKKSGLPQTENRVALSGMRKTIAARLTETSLLGCLVQRFGGRIEWDAANMRITNRPELNAYIREPARKGWSYGEDLWKEPGLLERLTRRLLGK